MPTIHHLTLSVTDAVRSAAWYQELLGSATVFERDTADWKRTRLQWPDGFVLGLTQHFGTSAGDRFDHRRIGLDHIGVVCAGEDEVRSWVDRMDALGVVHGPLEDAPYGWAITARDPDGIAVEFFCPKG